MTKIKIENLPPGKAFYFRGSNYRKIGNLRNEAGEFSARIIHDHALSITAPATNFKPDTEVFAFDHLNPNPKDN